MSAVPMEGIGYPVAAVTDGSDLLDIDAGCWQFSELPGPTVVQSQWNTQEAYIIHKLVDL